MPHDIPPPHCHAASSAKGQLARKTACALGVAGDQPGWYLIHTKPRQEELALLNLERQGYHCYLPQLRIEKMIRRKAQVVTEPMFPRYLFIELNTSPGAKSWSPIRSTLGVSQLVHFGSHPAKVDVQLVEKLRHRELTKQTQALFSVGDTVLITEGPFAGIEATFQMADAERRSLVLLDLLSKAVHMRIDTAILSKLT
jgi:transcriptional antiterminator RfaH